DLPYGKYHCWIEANQSFDFNQYHNYSWYRGQPSVVWNVSVMVGDSADSSMVLDYQGYGSPNGSDGNIRPPDSTITTAANLLVNLGGYRFKVVYSPTAVGVGDHLESPSPMRYFYLDHNYPNPFNSSTVISFQLPTKALVKIRVYDILGQEIRELINEKMDSGIKKVVWDGKNNQDELVPSGLYFCRMEAGNYANTRKMLFIR
ncbi:MAG: T9SS type A sorting domain-containing protein, partial [candidate division KSB1 bacterium]|nr:T9SS type A sorting domain-containing protein [candidate division KSB1 bacterium]